MAVALRITNHFACVILFCSSLADPSKKRLRSPLWMRAMLKLPSARNSFSDVASLSVLKREQCDSESKDIEGEAAEFSVVRGVRVNVTI